MRRVASWRIGDGSPIRLHRSEIDLEKDLEEWIFRDPAMVGEGYRILARQLTLPLGGRTRRRRTTQGGANLTTLDTSSTGVYT